jgi:hypothetical protein
MFSQSFVQQPELMQQQMLQFQQQELFQQAFFAQQLSTSPVASATPSFFLGASGDNVSVEDTKYIQDQQLRSIQTHLHQQRQQQILLSQPPQIQTDNSQKKKVLPGVLVFSETFLASELAARCNCVKTKGG